MPKGHAWKSEEERLEAKRKRLEWNKEYNRKRREADPEGYKAKRHDYWIKSKLADYEVMNAEVASVPVVVPKRVVSVNIVNVGFLDGKVKSLGGGSWKVGEREGVQG